MGKIVFFCIPAYGHTNPTIEVVRELINRGNEVWYYSFNEFKGKIEDTGANFISCDDFLPSLPKNPDKVIGKDFNALIEMIVDTTASLDNKVCKELKEIKPDMIVSDSICFWGKLFAKKLNIKYVCSTTTFAYNEHTAKLLKQSKIDIFKTVISMRKINKKLDILSERGYDIKNPISMISNDNDTYTIVYTSKEFQPMIETFSDKFSFVGPSIPNIEIEKEKSEYKRIYVSLGTVNNKNLDFYKNCIKAFKDSDYKVIMSVGTNTQIEDLGEVPENFEIKNSVNQIEVLQNTDLFITHSGMNSVNESLYYGVPMVLFPQQSEQRTVATRVEELGAGLILKNENTQTIINTVNKVINNNCYKEKSKKIGECFRQCGGAKKAADFIMEII